MPTNPTEALIAKFEDHARTALAKDRPEDLTADERAAVLMFAGVPYEIDHVTGAMRFGPHAIDHRDGRWMVFTPAT